MTKITLYRNGKPQDYTNAHDITISPAGVMTFYGEISEGGTFKKPKAYKFQTSVPFVVEEDVAGGSCYSVFLFPCAVRNFSGGYALSTEISLTPGR